MHELFEHTADLGLRIRASDMNTLFAEAGACLFSAIVDDVATIEAKQTFTLEIAGTDREFLLFDWLRELLYRCEESHMLFSVFDVQVTDVGLKATIGGEAIDREKHELSREVKAITYHELKLIQENGEWLAELIVDI